MSDDERPTGEHRALFAASGLVAAGVGLGIAELSSSLNRAWRSPVEVVAEVVIDKAPSSITKFGIEVFGTNDKLALVIGILVTLTIIGLVVGLASRRRPIVGDVAFGLFAVVGAGAALQVANAPLSAIVPSLVAGGIGALTLRLLQGRLRDLPVTKPVSDEGRIIEADGPTRRTFLALTGALVAVAAVAAAGGRALRDRFSAVDSRNNLVLPDPDQAGPAVTDAYATDVEGMTPFTTSNADFYRIDTALTVPQVPVESWELEVKGMVDEPLPLEHGFPARLVTAGLYGYISATKWLTEIELTTFEDFESYWVPRGYADRAPIRTQCRIDIPRTGEQVTAGPQFIAGVAWAQTKGITKVEIKVDDGPWQEAELADELTDETWRQWRIEWDAQPGSPRILCRATDGDGVLMSEERTEPLPDGASGWQSKLVIVQAA